jgi:helix-turn-helix protein
VMIRGDKHGGSVLEYYIYIYIYTKINDMELLVLINSTTVILFSIRYHMIDRSHKRIY